MKKLLPFLFCLFFVGQFSAQTMFQETYSRKWQSQFTMSGTAGVIQQSDGSYVVAGSGGHGISMMVFLMKIGTTGDTIWNKYYGDSTIEYVDCTTIISANDGGFLLCGHYFHYYNSDNFPFMIKVDSLGNIQWANFIQAFPQDNEVNNGMQDSDGSYLLLGSSTLSTSAGVYDGAGITRVSSSGTILYSKSFTTTDCTYRGYHFARTSDNGYIISAEGTLGCLILKLDSNEQVSWAKRISGPNFSVFDPNFISQTLDGGYVLVATCGVYPYFYPNIIKTDSAGNIQWAKSYGITNGEFNSAILMTNGTIVLCGSYLYNSNSDFILKTNYDGTIVWSKMYNDGPLPYYADNRNHIIQTMDDGLAMSLCNGYGAVLVKSDSTGDAGCNVSPFPIGTSVPLLLDTNIAVQEEPYTLHPPNSNLTSGTIPLEIDFCSISAVEQKMPSEKNISVYPNPSSSKFTFDFQNAIVPQETKLEVFDCLGNKVVEENITQQKTTIEKKNLSEGIYFWRITSKTKILGSGKIIVQE